MAPTPSSKSNQPQGTLVKTPQSKHRLHFNPAKSTHPSPNPSSAIKEITPADHPVEVIGRIRDYPDRKEKPVAALQINSDRQTLRVRTDIGYRDFSLDGVSLSEEEDLDGFYKKFIGSRINGVKLGDKCTIMMYGPTGSGKSHTMFGSAKQPGIVYRSLRDILGGEGEEIDTVGNRVGIGSFVQVTVLEIYNEEIYDLLSNNSGGGGLSLGWSKGSASKVRLEVMGKKAKNATFISGNEAGKISKEIQKVEKRRIVKSTLCNERSSRSHCMIILDVPTVGGRLMLVDMAGSENIEQAGQTGFEAKMQTAKINQGNIALKRVVESIANGDSHVPFRDSKLTMLLQDSFEDDKSKILMILCASPDPKEMHKTISTLEYGAKAKCIVRGHHTPIKDGITSEDSSSTVILGSRIAAMDQFIYKLQMENKQREKERNEAHQALLKKEEEVSALRAKLELAEANEEKINSKVNERTQFLKRELERKLIECQKMASEFVELGRRKMEEKILQQQRELEMLRQRLEEIESELCCTREKNGFRESDGSGFVKRVMEIYGDEDPGMEKSMELDFGDQEQPTSQDLKYIEERNYDSFEPQFGEKVNLSTVFEEEEEGEEESKEKLEDEAVEKEIVEDKTVYTSPGVLNFNTSSFGSPSLLHMNLESRDYFDKTLMSDNGSPKDSSSSRRKRIQNIFTLCGNYRELSQHIRIPAASKKKSETFDVKEIGEESHVRIPQFQGNPISDQTVMKASVEKVMDLKENFNPLNESNAAGSIEIYVKWEASKENPGKFITKLKIVEDSSLADLRKLIEIHLGADNQAFSFLVLGDPSGAPVQREKEATIQVSKLPRCSNQLQGHLACLRPVKGGMVQPPNHLPLTSLENKIPLMSNSCLTQKDETAFSPNVAQKTSPISPYVTAGFHL